jgi:hypothetical protein
MSDAEQIRNDLRSGALTASVFGSDSDDRSAWFFLLDGDRLWRVFVEPAEPTIVFEARDE